MRRSEADRVPSSNQQTPTVRTRFEQEGSPGGENRSAPGRRHPAPTLSLGPSGAFFPASARVCHGVRSLHRWLKPNLDVLWEGEAC